MKEKDLLKRAVGDNIADKEKIRKKAINSASPRQKNSLAWKRGLVAAIVLVVVGVGVISGMALNFSPSVDNNNSAQNATAYAEIYSAIESFNEYNNSYTINGLFSGMKSNSVGDSAAPEGVTSMPSSYADSDNAERSSETNVQTEGMDEGDLVKVQGNYIYKLNTEGCSIINAISGKMTLTATIKVDNYVPVELYIANNGDTLVMIGGIYESYNAFAGSIEPMYDWCYYATYSTTNIRIYDIRDKANPILQREITVDGNYYTSRLEIETSRLYYMVNYNFYYGNVETYIPKVTDTMQNDGEENTISAENIFYYSDIPNYSYLIIGYINLDDPQEDAKQAAYLGLSGTIYVSRDNIFVATYDYGSVFETNFFGWRRAGTNTIAKTRIVKIALNDLLQKAVSRVKGTIKDRYSLDEYEGYLRIATTINADIMHNAVYVMNSQLELTDKIENIAEGERIYAVRFNGETGSLVTFFETDPYYRLDLRDPYDIKISEGLKKPGVSYYIHYIEGTDYTIGIGRTAETINGWTMWTGLEIILYYNDPADPLADPSIVTELFIEGNCYAEVLYNPKALLYDKELGLLAFAYEKWNYSYWYSYTSMQQGLAVFSFDTEAALDEDKLINRGTLTNLALQVNLSNNYQSYYNSYWSFISRGIFIGDYIYTISDQFITSYTLDTLEKADQIELR